MAKAKLLIDPSDYNKTSISLVQKSGKVMFKNISGKKRDSGKLIKAVDSLLAENKIKLGDLSDIKVKTEGGSFTSQRIAVTVANALSFSINKSSKVIIPKYSAPPSITVKKD